MKTISKAITTIMLLFITPFPLFAQVKIEATAKQDMRRALSKPAAAYQLNLKENQKIFKRVDALFNKYINFDEATRKKGKNRDELIFKLRVIHNKPIPPTEEKVEGIRNDLPFTVWYIKTPRKRSLIKELRAPVPNRLPEGHLIKLGREFITQNRLCRISGHDRLGPVLVLSRNSHPFTPDATREDKLTLSQRVIFEREFNGLPIVNSRQIVDIHPKSLEIIAYKSINWTPVAESTRKAEAYISEEQLQEKIATAIGKTKAEYTVYKVKPAMYQSETLMLPVLLVYIHKPIDGSDIDETKRVLVISLIEGVEVGGERRDIKRPAQATQ